MAIGLRGADEASDQPACGDSGERREVVVTFDLGEFGEQCEVGAKAGECLQKAAEALAGGVDDAVVSLRIVEAIAEGAV